MDALDAWPGSPALYPGPYVEPSLELGTPSGWSGGLAAEGPLGEIDIAATPAAVRLARSYVRELASEYFGADADALDNLELLTSEAVTNAVVHAAPLPDGTVMVAALHLDRHVRVEVTDGGPRPRPSAPSADSSADSFTDPFAGPFADLPGDPFADHPADPGGDPLVPAGRGLRLVQTLAAGHGWLHNTDGTTTFWFEVAAGGDLPGGDRADDLDDDGWDLR